MGSRGLAPCLMVQGSASGVGKSTIATALCRVLAEEGYRVAPFKAQNMSNNAAVTADGGEIGRAQAAQAEAAGIESTVDMNPLLLKPEAEDRSQLVVRGRVVGSVTARDHWAGQRDLWPVVTGSLRKLRTSADVVVIEGAGSPAELNLRRRDLANMRVARHAHARVLLVGDIERGGIFAQLLGTLDLLPPAERALVSGLIVNRFRGDRSLFDDGARILARRARLPVLGVLPFDRTLPVPPEDSQSLDAIAASPEDAVLTVAVVAYPRVANFDDVFPLRAPAVRVSIVREPEELGWPDLVVLPGSKSTLDDLAWLRTTGLAAAIVRRAEVGVPILGVCGGFQMLGERLDDPVGVEGPPRSHAGLGLLPVATTFLATKTTRRTTASAVGHSRLLPAGTPLVAYEIHQGETTTAPGTRPFARTDAPQGALDGAVSEDGLVSGTYLHGLFAGDEARDALLTALALRRGVAVPSLRPGADWGQLSAWLREGADVPAILRLIR